MSPLLQLFSLDLVLLGAAGIILLLDGFVKLPGKTLGAAVFVLLCALFGASFFVDLQGAAPHGVYVSDPFGLYLKRLFYVAGALGVLGTIDWLDRTTPRRQAEYYVLFLFSLAGMTLLPGARDFVLLVVLFELMGIPLIVLAAWAKHDALRGEGRQAAEAGLKLFLTSAASSAVTFFGLALIVGLSGTTRIAGFGSIDLEPLAVLGLLFLLAGFAFKVGAAPFHMWVPDTYEGAPTPFVAFLSVAPKAAGIAALAIVLEHGFGHQREEWGTAVGLLAGASMIVGNFFALPQLDARRLLGFSGVAQIGYLLVALAAGTRQGLGMALFFLATYVFTNMGAFFVIHAASESSGGHTLPKLAGLSRRSPWLGGALLVFLLSLAGIPFVVGFWSKLFLFLAAWKAGEIVLVVLAVTTAVIGLFYYLSVARSTFMADGTNETPVRPAAGVNAAIALCLLAVVGLGLWPGPLVDAALKAASGFGVGP